MEAFAWLIAHGVKFWFAACIEMEWSDEEVIDLSAYNYKLDYLKILETLDRVKNLQMSSKLMDKTILDDYNKFDPAIRTEIVKKRPKIKEIILEVGHVILYSLSRYLK